jgi:hypothetical protein
VGQVRQRLKLLWWIISFVSCAEIFPQSVFALELETVEKKKRDVRGRMIFPPHFQLHILGISAISATCVPPVTKQELPVVFTIIASLLFYCTTTKSISHKHGYLKTTTSTLNMSVIPTVCTDILIMDVYPCVADPFNGNCLARCFDDQTPNRALPSFDFLFVPDYAETCAEFEEPLCWPTNLPGCCPSCAAEFRSLYRCMVTDFVEETADADVKINLSLLRKDCPLNCIEFDSELDIDGNATATNITESNFTDFNFTDLAEFNETRFLR